MAPNPYLPLPARIADIHVENDARDIKSFWLELERPEDAASFGHRPGQFALLSLPGSGEAAFGIASAPNERPRLLFSVKRIGVFTQELHASEVGRSIGVRGPMGSPFPWESMQGQDLVIVSGGFAFTTLRAAIHHLLEPGRRRELGKVTVLYGARSPGELLYKRDLDAWAGRNDLALHVTVDRSENGWTGRVGVVPKILEELAPSGTGAVALVCGPPVMIRYTLPVLDKLGFDPASTYLSLENRMKCGIGKCGRCNVGPKYVCTDGPVFSREELSGLPQEY